jgi:hypothetical protein
MKAESASSQLSLKLVESAEIQIWRTGALGVITNLPGGSSKATFKTPFCSSTSKPASTSSSRRIRCCISESRAASATRRNCNSSSMFTV